MSAHGDERPRSTTGSSRLERSELGRAFHRMSDLEALIERLRAEQHFLVLEAKGNRPLPGKGILQRIADLETKIQAVEALIEDR